MPDEDDGLIVMCAYLTAERLQQAGNVPGKCGMCGQGIVISAAGVEMMRNRDSKPVCADCMAKHAPEDVGPLIPDDQKLMLATLGFPDDFIEEQEAMPIKRLAAIVADHHHRTALN